MVNEISKRYSCPICGAEFICTKGGSGQFNCCGQPMTKKVVNPNPPPQENK